MGRVVNNDDQQFSYIAEVLRMLKLAHVEVQFSSRVAIFLG